MIFVSEVDAEQRKTTDSVSASDSLLGVTRNRGGAESKHQCLRIVTIRFLWWSVFTFPSKLVLIFFFHVSHTEPVLLEILESDRFTHGGLFVNKTQWRV